MPVFDKLLCVSGDRESIRKQVISAFLTELPGCGRGENATRYTYHVESTALGERIFLSRPAPLNKGMDFLVCASHARFLAGRRRVSNPSHRNIHEDLLAKKHESLPKMNIVLPIITSIYQCQDVAWEGLPIFEVGYDIELILKIIKWLFIEQDVTYWNWSGREMLYKAIMDSLGPL